MRVSGLVLFLAIAFSALTAIPGPHRAFAADGIKLEDGAGDDVAPATKTPPAKENPYQNQLRAAALKLSKSLGKDELGPLNQLRAGFGMVRAVRITQETVGEAVPACAEGNPDLQEKITARHEAWEESVGAALAKAEKDMDAVIEGGLFKKPAGIRAYFDLTDKAARFADGQAEKRVVTTPEACENLLKSMDATETQLTELLSAIRWPQKKAVTDKAETPPKTPAADVGKYDKRSLPPGEH